MKSSKEKPQDAKMAFISANAFFTIAGKFFSEVPKDLNASAEFAGRRRGDLVAAVTNLALSIELYLKALAIRTGVNPKKTHNLWELFDSLPQRLRDSIEARYNLRVKHASPDALTAFEMVITSTPELPDENKVRQAMALRPTGDDIRSILKGEQDAFRSWRYLHEAGVPGGVTVFQVAFHRLGLIANTLQEHLAPRRKKA